jgi:hypothetical protein
MDQQGAVIPAADVTLLDVTTSARRTATTNEAGRYVFVSVPPGTYDIVVSRSGFQTARVSAQKVTVGQELTIDLTLTVGGVAQSIDVVASAAAQLQTTSATVGATLTGASVILLPNLSRDAYALQTLNVGVTPAGEVAGTRNDQNTYLVDGANVTDDNSGNLSYNTMPNLSAVATGAKLRIEGGNRPYAEMNHDPEIARLYRRNAEGLGRFFVPHEMVDRSAASTDMGNVSLVIPSIHPMIGIDSLPAVDHQPEFAAHCIKPAADKAVIDGAIAMAWTAIDLASNSADRDRLIRSRQSHAR